MALISSSRVQNVRLGEMVKNKLVILATLCTTFPEAQEQIVDDCFFAKEYSEFRWTHILSRATKR